MKLDRSIFGAALVALSVVCGCSASPAPLGAPRTASQASTTLLTSADSFAARSPKVGKAQLVADEDLGGGSVAETDELAAPKEPRRATRHARGGYFGTSK
ncbi:MAG: hypothetical protein JST00_33095 [Deltaproteobacteria bacterium]|nr:hypothetical protein [Deltaproteobacteria bacterium]